MLVWIFFSLSEMEFIEFLGYVESCVSRNVEIIWSLFIQTLFPFLFLLGQVYAYVDKLDGILNVSQFLFIFFILCISASHQDNFNWPTFKFSDSFFYLLKSVVESLQWIFHFSYRTFNLQNFYLAPIYNFSLLMFSVCSYIILFVSFSSLSIFP